MTPGDLVVYHGGKGAPKPALLLRYLSAKKAVILLAGQQRSVHVRTLRAIGD